MIKAVPVSEFLPTVDVVCLHPTPRRRKDNSTSYGTPLVFPRATKNTEESSDLFIILVVLAPFLVGYAWEDLLFANADVAMLSKDEVSSSRHLNELRSKK